MKTHYSNLQDLVHAVKEEAETDIELTTRPYNRFDALGTVWWLMGTTEWPAYKFGKLFIDSRKDFVPLHDKGMLYSGFYIEKGLNSALKLRSPQLLLDSSWLWNEFISTPSEKVPFKKGDLLTLDMNYAPLEKVRFGDSPEAWYAQKEQLRAARITFLLDPPKVTVLGAPTGNPSQKDLMQYLEQTINKATTLEEIFATVPTIPDSDWLWVDLYIGTVKSMANTESGPFWQNEMKRWIPWLRSAQ